MISVVAARSLNGVIGNGPKIPWSVKGEQKLFRDITMGGILIMGRKTFETIGKALPGRGMVIITRNEKYIAPEGCDVAFSLTHALSIIAASNDMDTTDVHICGGGEIYQQALSEPNLVDVVHLTTIQTEVSGDVMFPTFPSPAFYRDSMQFYSSNIDYVYERYYIKDLLMR